MSVHHVVKVCLFANVTLQWRKTNAHVARLQRFTNFQNTLWSHQYSTAGITNLSETVSYFLCND